MRHFRPIPALLTVTIAMGLTACDSPTTSECTYNGNAPGIELNVTDQATGKAPSSTPVVTATATDGHVTTSGGVTNYGDSTIVFLFVGVGSYSLSISAPGYKTFAFSGTVNVFGLSDGTCSPPYTQQLAVALSH